MRHVLLPPLLLLLLCGFAPQKPFAELGLDSIIGVEWARTINRRYGLSMPAARIYDYPSVQQLAQYLLQLMAQRTSEGAPAEAQARYCRAVTS